MQIDAKPDTLPHTEGEESSEYSFFMREITAGGECPYFASVESLTTYRNIPNQTTAVFHHHLLRGWRRFGGVTFRPVCPTCDACQSLRIPLDLFEFSKSQRRIFKKNRDLRIEISSPQLTAEHLSLYQRFHTFRHHTKGWDDPSRMTPLHYQSQYIDAADSYGLEARYYEKDTLICVDLFDRGYDGLSAVYCYWDPRYANRSLGTLSLLWQIKIARQLNLSYVYLGYGVQANASLSYKYHYSPLEKLIGRPNDEDDAQWELFVPMV